MEQLLRLLEPLLARFRALDVKKRVMLITSVVLLVAAASWGYEAATATRYSTLFSNLTPEDAAQIVERLKDQHVPYTVEGGGTEIRVPEAVVHETRLTLAGEGLPNGGGVGFELFDQQRFGESEFSEQVKYHRALEGELARTVSHLAGVESARVHLVLPPRSLFANAEASASASVALKLKPGAQLTRDQTRGIVHLVASSVRGLTPETVTIVDGAGRKLAGGEDEQEIANTTLEFQRAYERAQERSVQQILDATLGPGRSVVRVAAEVSFSREEITEERVDPESVVERSHQILEERDISSGPQGGGVAGAVSSLTGAESTANNKDILRRSETRNFEVSKVTRRAIEPQGRVARVSVAVIVDGHWKADKNRRRQYTARSAKELEAIKNIVSTAAGFNATRGDQVTVETVPFADQAYTEPEPVKDPLAPMKPYIPLALFGVAVLSSGAIAFLVWRRRRKAKAAEVALELAKVVPPMDEAQPVADESVVVEEPPAPQLPEPAARVENPNKPAEDAEQLRTLTAEIAANDPYLAARIVRMWLTEGQQKEQQAV